MGGLNSIKAEGSAVLVAYMVISIMAGLCMLMGWCAHIWFSEDRLILCKSYEKYYYNKKLEKEENKL